MRQSVLLGVKDDRDNMDVLFNSVSYELTLAKARELISSGLCNYYTMLIYTKHGVKKVLRNHNRPSDTVLQAPVIDVETKKEEIKIDLRHKKQRTSSDQKD